MMKILIAEDDPVSRSFLSRFLKSYGDCDLVVDGREALDAFLLAWKDRAPYRLICLDITMPKADGMKILKGIRALEKQHGVTPEQGVKIIITTALDEAQLVRKAFDEGCDAYATKPIDTQKLLEVLKKLNLVDGEGGTAAKHDYTLPSASDETDPTEKSYFKSVRALPGYRLEIVMETGTTIHFDFRSRLNTSRFGRLSDETLFNSARTDGNYLIFEKAGKMPVKITASEFMDLVLIDRRK